MVREALPEESLAHRWPELARQAKALVSGLSLSPTFNNEHIEATALRVGRSVAWVEARAVVRRSVLGERMSRPLRLYSRSWFTREGRINNAAVLDNRGSRILELIGESSEKPKLVTLTFRSATESWRSGSAVRSFLNHLRTWASRQGRRISYLWTSEIQDRWAVHYHIVLLGCPYLPWQVLRSWWQYGRPGIEAIRSDQAIGYVTKYVRKSVYGQGDLDEVRHLLHSAARLRRHGATRDVTALPALLPLWVREACQLCGVTGANCDYVTDDGSDTCALLFRGEVLWTGRYSPLKWRLSRLSTDLGKESAPCVGRAS